MHSNSRIDRRAMIAASLLGSGSLAFAARANTPADNASTGARFAIHQENEFAAPLGRIYAIFLDSKSFAAMTGSGAEIGKDEGDAFSMFGGIIVGRNIELVPGTRIVQAWRPKYWSPGVYSLVKFEFVGDGEKTKIVLDQTGFPPGTYRGLNAGWPKRYWTPLEKYLAANP